jgi:hypothetical protein
MEQLKLFSKKPITFEKTWESASDVKKMVREFQSKEEYYKSEEWQSKRLFALHRAGNRCDKCASRSNLEVHHLTYEHLYDEKPEDLTVLCPRCHKSADRKREYENWYNGAFETYMSKKYGEEWDYFDGCEEEFDAWIESKEDAW